MFDAVTGIHHEVWHVYNMKCHLFPITKIIAPIIDFYTYKYFPEVSTV